MRALYPHILGLIANPLTLVEQVAQHPRSSDLAVIMLTSAGERGDAARCRKLGIAGYLMKPVSQSDLYDAIVATFGGHAGHRPLDPGR